MRPLWSGKPTPQSTMFHVAALGHASEHLDTLPLLLSAYNSTEKAHQKLADTRRPTILFTPVWTKQNETGSRLVLAVAPAVEGRENHAPSQTCDHANVLKHSSPHRPQIHPVPGYLPPCHSNTPSAHVPTGLARHPHPPVPSRMTTNIRAPLIPMRH